MYLPTYSFVGNFVIFSRFLIRFETIRMCRDCFIVVCFSAVSDDYFDRANDRDVFGVCWRQL